MACFTTSWNDAIYHVIKDAIDKILMKVEISHEKFVSVVLLLYTDIDYYIVIYLEHLLSKYFKFDGVFTTVFEIVNVLLKTAKSLIGRKFK